MYRPFLYVSSIQATAEQQMQSQRRFLLPCPGPLSRFPSPVSPPRHGWNRSGENLKVRQFFLLGCPPSFEAIRQIDKVTEVADRCSCAFSYLLTYFWCINMLTCFILR